MLECAPNFRDLGGLIGDRGRRVRPGLVFRSDAVLRPTEADIAYLRECRIGVVMDLRSSSEAADDENEHFRENGAELFQLNVGTDVRAKGSFWEKLASDSSPQTVRDLLHSIYRSIPMAVAPALQIVFERIEAGSPPILTHCAAGKDRTGVAVALLLHALGSSMDGIMKDYLETQNRLTQASITRSTETLAAIVGEPLHPESLSLLSGVRRDFLKQSFSWMDRKYDGADGFLESCAGLTNQRKAAIRRALLEPE